MSSSSLLKRKRPSTGQPDTERSDFSTSAAMGSDIPDLQDLYLSMSGSRKLNPLSVAQSMLLLQVSAFDDFVQFVTTVFDQFVAPESLVTPEALSAALAQILAQNPGLAPQILDIISQYWTDNSAEVKARLSTLLQLLTNSSIIPTELAIELVDRNILQDSQIIANSQILATRTVRINTGLLYKQQKFNLLREENEGYGKLSHEFNLALSDLPKAGAMDF